MDTYPACPSVQLVVASASTGGNGIVQPVFLTVLLCIRIGRNYNRQFPTSGKRIHANRRNTIRDCDARQPGATVKCVIANPRQTVRERDARQTGAAQKRFCSNRRHTVRERDARQTEAVGKCTFFN